MRLDAASMTFGILFCGLIGMVMSFGHLSYDTQAAVWYAVSILAFLICTGFYVKSKIRKGK